MNVSMIARAAMFAAAGALAGCGGQVGFASYPSYQVDVPRLAVLDGPVPVALTGAPLPAADLVAAMNAEPNVYGMVFATDRAPGKFGYRIALDFSRNTANPCLDSTASAYPAVPAGDSVPVVAAFCRYGAVLSQTSGLLPRAASAGDPEVRKFMKTLVAVLLPTQVPGGFESNQCRNPPNC